MTSKRSKKLPSRLLFVLFLLILGTINAEAGDSSFDFLDEYLDVEPKSIPLLGHMPTVNITDEWLEGAKKGITGCKKDPLFPVGVQTLVNIGTNDGRRRQFIIYVPFSYSLRVDKPAALKMLFHGLNDYCDTFLNDTEFTAYAGSQGYILVSACGTPGYFGAGWNTGVCCGFSEVKPPDDVDFVERIIDAVSYGACVDRGKTMAVGFSNGGIFVQGLACRSPPIVRAVASVAGVVALPPGGERGLLSCAKELHSGESGCRTSVLMINGARDKLIPLQGNPTLRFPPVEKNLRSWITLNGCSTEAKSTLSNRNYRNEIYRYCNSDNTGSGLWFFLREVSGWPFRFLGSAFSFTHDVEKDENYSEVSDQDFNCKISEVEIVYAKRGRHVWFKDRIFSATRYIYLYGLRLFGEY
uniref:Uncharacterized protein TCIL3000_10_8360 n=1 Tax=Trypanosoma congolense (strain IL3000) TaxID=1068625 RepID=G0UXE3_TRYCI|nr:unnamed protein product [Trypanosoma congolense IL3000]